MTNPADRLLSRREGVARIREVLGIPIGLSAFEKAGANGTGPRPSEKYGKTLLYRESEILAWARTLTRSVDAA